MNLISGNRETSSRLSALAYSPRKLSKRPAPSHEDAIAQHEQIAEEIERAAEPGADAASAQGETPALSSETPGR
jgi:hypothetical protein